MADYQTIITDHKPRHIVYGFELTDVERAEFDWMDEEELPMASFFRYYGNVYALENFTRATGSLALLGWDGYDTDTYFSGTLVRYSDDMESVYVARIFC